MPMLIDVANAFSGMARPGAAADPVGEIGHLVEHGVHFGHDVLAIHYDGGALRRAQGDVQNGAVFGDIDFLAAETWRRSSCADPDSSASCNEELQRFVGDAILRVIEINACGLNRHPLSALRVIREQLPQM